MRVLIVGYVCIPQNGGETSHTWNWAWHLSRFHEICVLAHPTDRSFVESPLVDCPNSKIRFHWLAVPRFLDPRDGRGSDLALAVHYLQWLRLAHVKAVELHKQIGFDIVHHVSYGTINAAPLFWKMPVPFVWGPVGGAQRVPSAFRRYISYLSGREFVRDVRVRLLPLSPSLHKTAKSSAMILATNRETYGVLTRVGARNVRLFLDSGIPSSFVSGLPVAKPGGGPFTLLWVGRLSPRKCLPLALEALAETKDINARLLVVGDGEMRRKWERYATGLNLHERVVFLGPIPWNEMSGLYRSADAFIFTSLRDSFGTQVLEAMAHKLPILTLDHQGVGTFAPPEAGIKVPVACPHQTVAALAAGIRRLALCPEERLKMGEAAYAYARTQTWERRAERMSEVYEEVVARQLRKDQMPSRMNGLSA